MSIQNLSETDTAPIDTRPVHPFYKQLRENVQELLNARGMTQKELAAASGIPYSTLNKKMRGVHEVWRAQQFAGLYNAFDGDELLFRGLKGLA